MCCFSRPVRSVTETTIFARLDGAGRQFVVYAMRLDAPEDLAMILPVPVAPGSGEKHQGLVHPDLHVLRHPIRGQLKNEDVVVPVAAA